MFIVRRWAETDRVAPPTALPTAPATPVPARKSEPREPRTTAVFGAGAGAQPSNTQDLAGAWAAILQVGAPWRVSGF